MSGLVRRGFIDLEEGQVHFRMARCEARDKRSPLILLHSSPTSSKVLEKFAVKLASGRDVIAFDTLGQGDSCAPRDASVMMDYFADATIRALDSLGAGFERVDIYGTHTGARIAAEMAILHPTRVRRLIIDGIRRMPASFSESYVEAVDLSRHIDHDGSQFFRAWNRWRDEYLFKPPHRWLMDQMTGSPLPSPMAMHEAAIEVFKGIPFAHIAYRAAIHYRVDERLPLIARPTLVTCGARDGAFVDLDYAASLIPGAVAYPHPEGDRVEHATDSGLAALANMLVAWLDQPTDGDA